MSIGDNIKKIREQRNLRQSELAEILGVSDKTISSWEINRTEPKMGMVEKICDALKCRKTDIIGNEQDSIDEKATAIGQEILNNEELRKLFDASRDVTQEDLRTINALLLSLKKAAERKEK
ncbi:MULTISPECIES: helix-turn-helix domain-containing protein [Eisenbergiella]|uniref:Helix-turn-helix domain-containing protein n=1 Tax=Eisenbergiella porci TaxID=2652274 RepID=A0A6N7W6K0_9FIRM|nr:MULTISPECIES: helix-turn-helix domain-containing protein [Eisenbergiella]MDY2652128.1 helix-turn-helix domain-containing protein [Eisenbergiella porci]MSS90896.1 helix-turn-helix domain-containing protein [Eisenbergiella porci]